MNTAWRGGPAANSSPGPAVLRGRRAPGDSPRIQEAGPQDHDGLARALLQLHLDGAELAMDDADHSLDLLRGDGPGPALLTQQVHHVGGELVAGLEGQDSERRAWVSRQRCTGCRGAGGARCRIRAPAPAWGSWLLRVGVPDTACVTSAWKAVPAILETCAEKGNRAGS